MAISDKLTYLNDTKTQLKDMINYGLDTGEKITSETTFRNYVKSLFDAFIKTMTYPDVLYNNLPKVTGEGTSLSLNDTVYAPMKIELSPSALEQETTSGKNLIGTNYITGVTVNDTTTNDITIRNNWASTIVSNENLLKILEPSTTYTISYKYKVLERPSSFGSNNTVYILGLYDGGSGLTFFGETQKNTIALNTWDTITKTFTTPASLTNYRMIAYDFKDANNSTTGAIEVSELQIEKGSSATTFETFTYGASPNPQYPQQIHTVSGENTIEIIGKNLIEGNTQHSYARSTNGIISIETSSNKNQYLGFNDKTKVEPSTQYSVKFYEVSGSYSLFYTTYDSTGTYIERKSFTSTDGTGTFTTGSNVYYVFCWLYSSSGPFTNDNTPIQLEKGSTATSYEPHQEQTYPISLGDLEYCKIGNYEDLFFKNVVGSEYYNSTLELDKWYLKKNIGKVVLDGSELDWFNDGGGAPYAIHISNILLDNTKVVVMSDYFIGVSYNSSWTTYDALVSTSIQTAVNPAIKFRYTGNTGGVEGFKTWLSTHNTSVYYILKTPTYTLLSDTLQTQLEAIWRANSYEEQTNVSQENADLPFVIKMSAIRDLSGIFEEI